MNKITALTISLFFLGPIVSFAGTLDSPDILIKISPVAFEKIDQNEAKIIKGENWKSEWGHLKLEL